MIKRCCWSAKIILKYLVNHIICPKPHNNKFSSSCFDSWQLLFGCMLNSYWLLFAACTFTCFSVVVNKFKRWCVTMLLVWRDLGNKRRSGEDVDYGESIEENICFSVFVCHKSQKTTITLGNDLMYHYLFEGTEEAGTTKTAAKRKKHFLTSPIFVFSEIFPELVINKCS